MRVVIVRKAAEKLLCGQIVPAFFYGSFNILLEGVRSCGRLPPWNKKMVEGSLSLENAILIITSILVATIVTIGVIMRYILHINFIGEEEILAVLAMWLYWVGYCGQLYQYPYYR